MSEPPPASPFSLLIVEDDAMLLGLLHTFFSRLGVQVWACASGAEAVAVYRRNQADISLVLLDVRMPEMDGPQTLTELRRIQPGVRACFMSGHLGDYTPEQLHALGALRVFDKPFRLMSLADELQALAGAERRRTA